MSQDGIFKPNENAKVIDFVVPKTVTEVRSFSGLVNFYGKFIKKLLYKMHPIYELLRGTAKDIIKWTDECDVAFRNIKQELICDKVICHFNTSLPLILTKYASNVGIGAILSHEYPDKSQRPIEYVSRTLSAVKQVQYYRKGGNSQ